jgi:hypothetical protein
MLTRTLRNWLLTQLTVSVEVSQILEVKQKNNRVFVLLGKEELTESQIKQLKVEADLLQRSNLWRIMQETVKAKAMEKAFTQSTDWEQVLSGKLMVHNLGIMQSIVKLIDDLKI